MTHAPRGFWPRFRRNRPAVASAALLFAMAGLCFATLPWSGAAMRTVQLAAARQPPGDRAWLGTDQLGRSLLARTLYGGAISLSLGLMAAGVAVGIGTTYGLLAGYVGGKTDEFMMRVVDVLYALPTILLVMLLAVALGGRLEALRVPLPAAWGGGWQLGAEWARFVVLALAIGGVSWLSMARVIRGQVLSLREQAFVEAARAAGLPTRLILIRHILPGLSGSVIVFATLTVPQAILQESFLSFLGVGVQPPQTTWGALAADGVRTINPIAFDWWTVVAPCMCLSLTLLALNFVGDGLRDAADQRGADA